MLTNLNPIIALWLLPVVLQIILPLTMLSVWTVLKLTRKIVDRSNDVKAGVVHSQAVLSS